MNEENFFFEPIAVIEHHGDVSRGHYTCDVKEKETGYWYRTNDNLMPELISPASVSKFGYVALFKRV